MLFKICDDILGGIFRAAAPINNTDQAHFYFIEITGIAIQAEYRRSNVNLFLSPNGKIYGKAAAQTGTRKNADYTVVFLDQTVRNGKAQITIKAPNQFF